MSKTKTVDDYKTAKLTKAQSDFINLLEAIVVSAQIHCSKCGKTVTVDHVDLDEAHDAFKEEGWFATAKNAYCPKCNKKRLKK